MSSAWALDPCAGHPRYESLKVLGRGSHSLVHLCRDRVTGEAVAIKFIQRGEASGEEASSGMNANARALHTHPHRTRTHISAAHALHDHLTRAPHRPNTHNTNPHAQAGTPRRPSTWSASCSTTRSCR